MLDKNQLESMTRCGNIRGCRGCKAMGDFGDPRPSSCAERAAQTALAYRALLEEAVEIDENCYSRETFLSKRIKEAMDAK